MATIPREKQPEQQEQPKTARPAGRAPKPVRPPGRRVRVAIRRVNPWSVLKFSLLFYFCLMLVVVIGLSILYMVVDAIGILDSVEDFLSALWESNFRIDGGFLFRTLMLIGLVSVGLWSALTVFIAFLYNLIADLVGGIEVTLSEKR